MYLLINNPTHSKNVYTIQNQYHFSYHIRLKHFGLIHSNKWVEENTLSKKIVKKD